MRFITCVCVCDQSRLLQGETFGSNCAAASSRKWYFIFSVSFLPHLFRFIRHGREHERTHTHTHTQPSLQHGLTCSSTHKKRSLNFVPATRSTRTEREEEWDSGCCAGPPCTPTSPWYNRRWVRFSFEGVPEFPNQTSPQTDDTAISRPCVLCGGSGIVHDLRLLYSTVVT